jgi:hypothetical protein
MDDGTMLYLLIGEVLALWKSCTKEFRETVQNDAPRAIHRLGISPIQMLAIMVVATAFVVIFWPAVLLQWMISSGDRHDA